MKVCFVAGTLGSGGAERQLLFMIKALRQIGVAVRVLSLTSGEDYQRRIENTGVRVEFIGSSGNRFRRLWTTIEHLRREPADIVQSSHFFSNIYAALAGRALGISSIGAVRGDLKQAIAANGRFGNAQLKWPHHLIANSQSAKAEAIRKGIGRANVDFVKNVVGCNGGASKKKIDHRKGLKILFAGRLVSLKRPEVFLRLASRLLRDLPDDGLCFQIAGDGPARVQLEKLARDLELAPNRIELLGEVRDMDSIYRSADILVLTSEHEGTPNVILEALSHGVPVVATRVGGVPEILPERAGFIVEPDDFENLVDRTKTLIRHTDLRLGMGAHGMKYVLKNHSVDYLTEKLVTVYSNVLNRGVTNG